MAVVRHEGRQVRPGLDWISRLLMERGRLQNEAGTAAVNLFAHRPNIFSHVSWPRDEGRVPPRELLFTLKNFSPVSIPTELDKVPVSLLTGRSNLSSLVSVQREKGREPPRELTQSLNQVKPVSPPIELDMVPVSLFMPRSSI